MLDLTIAVRYPQGEVDVRHLCFYFYALSV